ncbi:MAG: amidohydrolase family protein [Planctomycetes bacterium]|nr:amidohydrolase family protein [Planctomycetota bacterium]
MIDTHTHLGQLRWEDPGLKPSQLLRWMDRNGIEKAIIMAVEVPEELDFFVTTRDLLRMTRPHRDRLFPLCAVDPRHRYPGHFKPLAILKSYIDEGCVGYGENLTGLPVDDPMQQIVYAACHELRLPIVMHFDYWINRDRKGLPGFENMLKAYPKARFIGHSPNFWREISARYPPKIGYPKGPIVPGGRLDKLFKKYDNLYADLSAGSGYNAITRDPEFGYEFLLRWQDRLMFATDYLMVGQKTPIIEHIRTVGLPRSAFQKITRRNAEKVFRLPP